MTAPARRSGLLAVAVALARRPDLWVVAVAQAFRLAPRGWWRRWPPLPMPDDDYLRFRLVTAYGDPERPIEAEDLIAYLEWRKAWRRVA